MEVIIKQLNEDCSEKEYTFENQRIVEFNYWDWATYYWCIDGWCVEEVITIDNPEPNSHNTEIQIRSAVMPDGTTQYGLSCSLIGNSYFDKYPGANQKARGLNFLDAKNILLSALTNALNEYEYFRLAQSKIVVNYLTIITDKQLSLF